MKAKERNEKVTLGDYIRALQITGEEKDIEVDCIDAICYCGTRLTEAGKKHFKDALALPMYENERGEICPCVVSDNEEDYDLLEDGKENKLSLAWEMLFGMAGFCSCDKFDKWFIN